MAEQKPPEPPRKDFLQTLRDSFDQVERQLNELLADRSSREEARSVRARVQQFSLDLQKRNWESWARYFQTINLPTRTDILRMGKRMAELEQTLGRVESRLRSIERQLGDAGAGGRTEASSPPRSAGANRPRRTRKPPARPREESP